MPRALGSGSAEAISPDRKWVLAFESGSPNRLLMLPTGPGQPVTLVSSQDGITWARFLSSTEVIYTIDRSGKRLTFRIATNGGSAPVQTGVPVGVQDVHPGGHWMVTGGHVVGLDGVKDPWQPALEPFEEILRWSADGRYLFTWFSHVDSVRIDRLEYGTTRREEWVDYALEDFAGMQGFTGVDISGDG